MIKSGLDSLMILFYTNNHEKIEGITRLVKLIFLLIKEGDFKEFERGIDLRLTIMDLVFSSL